MTFTIPKEPPKLLVPGDTWKWYHSLSTDFPAATWTLTYTLIGPAVIDSGAGWTITAQSGSEQLVEVAASTTAGYSTPGKYRLIAIVTNGSETYTAAECVIEIAPAYRALTGDQRNHDELMVSYIETALRARLNGALEEDYTINGRSMRKIPTDQLEKMLGMYRARVWRKRNPGKIGPTIGVEMKRPTL